MSTDKLTVTPREHDEALRLLILLGAQTLGKPDTTVPPTSTDLADFARAWLTGDLIVSND